MIEYPLIFLSGCLTGAGILYLGIRIGYKIVYQMKENLPYTGTEAPTSQEGTWESENEE